MMSLRRACFPLILLISLVELVGCGGGSPGGNAPRGSINKPPANLVYPKTDATYTVGAAIQENKPTIDGVVYSCSSAPKLPAGLNINTNTCSITGSPTTINNPNSQYVITASNDAGATSTTLNITVEGTIGGTVKTGYSTGSGLTLHNDINGDSVNVSNTQKTFTFPTALKGKDNYTVSVSAQPSSPAQICTVSQSQGTMKVGGGNISSVAVDCVMSRTIGGSVSGLAGTGLTLLDNGGDKLSINANGNFTFPTALPTGATYAVTVFADPSHLTQSCNVSNGSGPVGSTDVTSVKVVCTTEWYWAGTIGTQKVNTPGTYPASAPGIGTPGGRYASAEWTDSSGQLWLFGGYGCDSSATCTLPAGGTTGTVGDLNDLWMYNTSNHSWTWEGGANTIGTLNTYPANIGDPGTPGARDTPVSWTVGNTLWMFGGYGADSTGTAGTLNDLWKYVPGTGWFWEGGSKTVNAPGIYTATATTTVSPGARYGAATWVDSNGNLWLFGGYGCDSSSSCTLGATGTAGELNDLWMYNPIAKSWTWEGGSDTKNAASIYTASTGVSVFPGAREGAAAWVSNGQVWLFGGFGFDVLNDFWKYVPGTGWTWEGGSQGVESFGNYVSVGSTGFPSARDYPSGWVDGFGRLWMYGGYGVASKSSTVAHIDDLWMYDPGASTWTWEGGTAKGDTIATYPPSGVSTGIPGARYVASSWADGSGSLWLFGGWGYDATQTDSIGYLSDMWVLQP